MYAYERHSFMQAKSCDDIFLNKTQSTQFYTRACIHFKENEDENATVITQIHRKVAIGDIDKWKLIRNQS